MTKSGNVWLVGFMGVGKSTIGPLLAEQLGFRFLDMDQEIELASGLGIDQLFCSLGERYFRHQESELVRALAAQEGLIIATGGGAVLLAENRDCMRASGHVVWLSASVDVILQRIMNDNSRPLLNVTNRRQAIDQLLAARQGIYESVCDFRVDTGTVSSDKAAVLIAAWVKAGCNTSNRVGEEM